MEKKAENVFNSADLKSPEVLWSFQYSQNLGGGGSGTPVAGHRISIQTLPESIKLQVVSIRPIRVDMVGDVFIRIPIY